jgi:hypothetical protein
MGKWRYSSTILNIGTRWRGVVSFMPLLLYLKGMSLHYPLDRRLGGPQSQSGCCGEEKNLLPFPGIISQFLSHPAYSPEWKGGEGKEANQNWLEGEGEGVKSSGYCCLSSKKASELRCSIQFVEMFVQFTVQLKPWSCLLWKPPAQYIALKIV